MKTRNNKAFTLVELLTVIGIISLLLALALPALNEARMRAREVGDRASLHSIAVAVESFANDMGYYPESGLRSSVVNEQTIVRQLYDATEPGPGPADQGAHRLVEALIGLDLLGYQKDNIYHIDDDGSPIVLNQGGHPVETKRWGPYVQLESVVLGTMQDAHPGSVKFLADSNPNPVFVDTLDKNAPKAILYYRARTSKKLLWSGNTYAQYSIYDWDDNEMIVSDEDDSQGEYFHPNFADPEDEEGFYKFIWDERTGMTTGQETDFMEPSARPYNKDSFILINAGRDHQYGTPDDVCNFQKR